MNPKRKNPRAVWLVTNFLFFFFIFCGISLAHADVIVDNGDPGTSSTGTWAASGASGSYGTPSVWSRDGATYTWHADLPQSGTYQVYMWWTQYSSRSTSAPVTITSNGGSQTVNVNQQINGGQWNLLGTYSFTSVDGGTVKLTASNPAPTSYCADAVKFVYTADAPGDVIVDNGTTGTSFTGAWAASGASGSYGTPSVWSRDGATYTWHADLAQTGAYQVYMWWTQYSSRSTSAPVTINYNGGSQTVNVNQQINGGQWNLLGTYSFTSVDGGTVKLTASNPAPTSYSADAVKFVYIGTGNITPTATIVSIQPNPAGSGQSVTFSGSGTDTDGTITEYSWRSSIDGVISALASFSKSDLSIGTHTIYFKVKDNSGVWSNEVSQNLNINITGVEHIYVCFGYAETTQTQWRMVEMLGNLGARQSGQDWIYDARGKTYFIHFVRDIDTMKQALMSPGSHIIYTGHASYGLGGLFVTDEENWSQKIESIRYIDDDRFFNYSSKWISVDLPYIRTKQAYPYFWPIFKDGSNGITPYRFNDPAGPPPYNYYLSYKPAGSSLYYKVETTRNSAMQRFFSSNVTPWFSSIGAVPDPNNVNHQKYFVVNNATWAPSTETAGTWTASTLRPGYYNENYHQATTGTGLKTFKWKFTIPTAGNYEIFAWWSAYSDRTTQAPYTITHANGSTMVRVNQQINGKQWNTLGQFYFNQGNYSVTLSDNVSGGLVIADGIRVSHVNNPSEILQADFRGDPLYGTAPLSVRFINQSTGGHTDREWDFGDGTFNSSRDDLSHIYTDPGNYTVSLSVSNSLQTSTRTKQNYVIVGPTAQQTRAEFRAIPQTGNIPLSVSFKSLSSGNIVSWYWTFGDGGTSSASNPSHTYSSTGNYTVRLTVRDSAGVSSSETKTNFVRAVVFEKNIDNVDYPLNHYGSRTILFRNTPEILESEMKFSRMFYNSCNSGNYYLDTFHRGTIFYTLGTPSDYDGIYYLEAYLQGKSDFEIWQILQDYEPVFDYYNFDKLPSQQ